MANEYQVTYRGTMLGQNIQHVRYFGFDDPPTSIQIQDFADQLGQSFESTLGTELSSLVTYNDIYFRRNLPLANGVSVTPSGWPFSGGSGGDTLGPDSTVNIRLRSAVLSLPTKGLVQLPAPPENQQSSGRLIPLAITTYGAKAVHFLTAYLTVGSNAATPLLYNSELATYNTVTSANVVPVLGRQKQRRLA